MKILYIANEFRDVQVAARALRSISPHVTVLWGCSADRAAFWIRQNPDLAALIVEVQVDSQGCVLLKHARSLGLNAPIVIVLPEGAAPPRESLEAGADDYLAKNGSFLRELPAVVTRTIERAQTMSVAPWNHLRSETVLADAVGSTSAPERRLGNFEASLHQREQSRAVGHSAAQRQEELEDLEQKLTHAMAALEEARHDHGLAAAEVERLAQREAELTSILTDAAATRHTLERRIADTEAALGAANERLSRERLVAVEQAAVRQTEFQAQLEQEVERRRTVEELLARTETARADAEKGRAEREAELDELIRHERVTRALVEQKLAHVEAAWRDVEQQHAAAMTTAAATLAERQAQFEAELSQAAAAHDDLRRQLSDAEAALEAARHDHTLTGTEAERLTRREGELTSMLTDAIAARNTLEHRLADIESASNDADERAARERLAAATRAAEREAELDELIRQERETRALVEQKLAHVEAAWSDAEQQHASAMTTAAATLADRKAQFESELSQAAAVREDLRRQLSDAEAALEAARHDHALTRTEIERLTRREVELTSMLTDATAAREELRRQLSDAEAALEAARHDHALTATEVERLTRREAALTSMLADAAATRNTLEHRLADIETAFADAEERATHERLAISERAAKREADLEKLIHQEHVTRALVEQKLAHVEAARRDAEQQHAAAMTTAATTLAERQAQFESELSQAAAAREDLSRQFTDAEAALEAVRHDHALTGTEVERLAQREAELTSMLTEAAATRDDLRRQLSDVEAALEHSRRREVTHREERDSLERGRLAAEEDIRRLAAEHSEGQRNLDEARRDFQRTLDLVSSEYADAQAALVASVSERDARLEEQAARYSASLQAVDLDRSQLQDGFEATVAARDREIEQLQKTLRATALELVGARTRCEVLQTKLPELQRQLDESRLEVRRQFHRAPVALGRCTRDGALTHFNRAFADVVDYRNPNELRGADFAKTVFESPDDLSWLIERCLSTHARESVETAWKRKNGERVVVRVSAVESAPDLIEIAAEDITDLRALQERLGQAHRMEAVGRVASEIAVTCGNLLRDVHQDAQQWLATVSDDAALRQRGERLLDEVTRAAGFLQRLAAYGDEQTSALEPVDLTRVLRDLRPVLKQVAGDEVALELPRISSPLNVDVKAEHVERLLVNLAGYGRERMPLGGRLKVELATVVVNQRFIAQYPSVRPGPHALITVTEVRRAARAGGSLQLGNGATTPDAGGVAPEKPGVDLGVLQELIRECGGHLWMTVEPAGHMVVKIHLPLCGSDDQAHLRTPETRTRLGRAAARWFGR